VKIVWMAMDVINGKMANLKKVSGITIRLKAKVYLNGMTIGGRRDNSRTIRDMALESIDIPMGMNR